MLVKRLETIFPVEILLRELNAPDPNRNFPPLFKNIFLKMFINFPQQR